MTLMIHEVLQEMVSLKTKKTKTEFLKKNNSLALRDILRGNFDDSIEFTLPKGTPPYNVNDLPEGSNMTLHQVTKKLSWFVKGGRGDGTMKPKIERMFIDILEGLNPKEAEVLVLMKDKKLTSVYKGITKTLVSEVFQGLIRK
tara:strand:+ start:975 stop:1403 length:429 start_codon:yes stop_codon:yes gene_type:complete